ncbi:MAG: type IV pilus modification protein PilV [Candidatus Competibacteraceae bacterium]|nr:type IV pilus modification protein PilV [Candidatus Competibacteraceae bacterium]MBK7984068.1 type IV pilus modification protein PilV [Candidatus Competibacteraceae bacterium]MBK8896045.1 type IV pilus modification protein PilV [Candidatus Competibacteraceae bacterium]MBK8963541.1 type IV pilus modification protein PilV [Candidatus Competibacteraceae bacterium]MBK9950433.1 type IV pilus modification protein PilV [Candidatus Competibacteraceae bacterium]
MTKTNKPFGKSSAGFTLLEVLVALVVLSVGLLGLASLQVNGLRFNHSAYLRTQATLLAEELADRMRANRPGFVAGNYDNPANLTVVAACQTPAGCTSAQMAQTDVAQWRQSLAALLPTGQGVVCLDTVPVELPAASTPAAPSCDGGTTYAIKIWWDDNRSGGANQRFIATLN